MKDILQVARLQDRTTLNSHDDVNFWIFFMHVRHYIHGVCVYWKVNGYSALAPTHNHSIQKNKDIVTETKHK